MEATSPPPFVGLENPHVAGKEEEISFLEPSARALSQLHDGDVIGPPHVSNSDNCGASSPAARNLARTVLRVMPRMRLTRIWLPPVFSIRTSSMRRSRRWVMA